MTKYFLICLLFISFISCDKKNNIKVIYVADLSSRNSQLGVSGRNGLLLGIEEINSNKGIDRKKIQLEFIDHKGSKEECYLKVKQKVDEGIDLIIGPLTSGMANAVIRASGKSTLIISPTVSTDLLSGIDDNFIRVIPAASIQGIYLSNIIKSKRNNTVVVIYDLNNSEYAHSVINGLKISNINNEVDYIYISFSDKTEFDSLVTKAVTYNPDGLLFITNGINAGGILQQYSKNSVLPSLYGVQWTKISDLLRYGGNNIEGMIVVDSYTPENVNSEKGGFIDRYKKKYKTEPSLASIYSYDAIMLYKAAALNQKKYNYEAIKKEILELKTIKGVTDNYRFDKYGDVVRKQSIFIIQNNKYENYEQ